MTSGCTRQSNRSLVVIIESCKSSEDVPSAESHSPHGVKPGLCFPSWTLTADAGWVLCAASELTGKSSRDLLPRILEDLTSTSFRVVSLVSVESSCWQRTEMRCGPKGTLKGAESLIESMFFLICPLESRLAGGASLGSWVSLLQQRFFWLWAHAVYCQVQILHVLIMGCHSFLQKDKTGKLWQSVPKAAK